MDLKLKDLFGNQYELIVEGDIPCAEVSNPDRLTAAPVVSVHVLTYNHGPYIGKALESIANQQTTFPYEILIGEDCSTDNTQDVCREYQKKYPDKVRLFVSDSNVGARRNNIRLRPHVRGKYLAICEGDDYWCDPLKLQKQVDYLEAHPECALVCTNYDRYFQDTGRLEQRILPDEIEICQNHQEQAGEVFTRDVFAVTCSVCLRTQFVRQLWESDPVLYQSTRFLMGDFQLFFGLAYRYPIHYLPESTTVYRIIGESASHSENPKKRVAFARSMLDITIYCLKTHPLPPEYTNRVACRSIYVMLVAAFFGDTFWRGTWPALRRIWPYGRSLEFYKRLAFLFSWFIFPFLRPSLRRKFAGLGSV